MEERFPPQDLVPKEMSPPWSVSAGGLVLLSRPSWVTLPGQHVAGSKDLCLSCDCPSSIRESIQTLGSQKPQGRGKWEECSIPPLSGSLSQGLGLAWGGILEQTGLLKESPKHVAILNTGDGWKSWEERDVAHCGVRES